MGLFYRPSNRTLIIWGNISVLSHEVDLQLLLNFVGAEYVTKGGHFYTAANRTPPEQKKRLLYVEFHSALLQIEIWVDDVPFKKCLETENPVD